MKKLVLGAVFAIASFGAASAADMAAKAAPPVIARPACAQFGGFYLGGHGGWNYNRNEMRDLDNYGFGVFAIDHVESALNSKNAWHGGVQAGYNFQRNCTVFGVQADWSWTNANSGSFHQDFPAVGQQTLNVDSTNKWFGTARARTGVVVDDLLIYISGGAAFARFDRSLTYINPAPPAFTQVFQNSSTRYGFAVGAGTEWSFSPNWSVVSEVLYMGFEREGRSFPCSIAATCGGLPVGTPFRYEFTDSIVAARIGVNYRFSGPVVARY